MEYSKNLKSEIARYNRELMRTYEQRMRDKDAPALTVIATPAAPESESAPTAAQPVTSAAPAPVMRPPTRPRPAPPKPKPEPLWARFPLTAPEPLRPLAAPKAADTDTSTRPRFPLTEHAAASPAVAMSNPPEHPPTETPPEPPAAPLPEAPPVPLIPTDTAYIQVRVTTGRAAFPIEGAHVTITNSTPTGEQAQFIAVTDRDGLTPVFPLPAVSGQLSLSPENKHPYTTYNVEVSAPGYFRVSNTDLPMFGGIHAIQSVDLIPLPEFSEGNESPLVFPEQPPLNLE